MRKEKEERRPGQESCSQNRRNILKSERQKEKKVFLFSPITQKGLRANFSLPLHPLQRQQQPAAHILTMYSTPNTTMVTISCGNWEQIQCVGLCSFQVLLYFLAQHLFFFLGGGGVHMTTNFTISCDTSNHRHIILPLNPKCYHSAVPCTTQPDGQSSRKKDK